MEQNSSNHNINTIYKNYYDKTWGENGYYSSTVTHVKYYFEHLPHSYEKFKDAMEYHNFYKLFCITIL